MAITPSLNNDHIRASFEMLLSLNLAFAFSYGITMYNLTQVAHSRAQVMAMRSFTTSFAARSKSIISCISFLRILFTADCQIREAKLGWILRLRSPRLGSP